MVIGRGLLAKIFSSYKDNNQFIIFVSGVSNSKEDRIKEFIREKELLAEVIKKFPKMTLVYFSTCAFYDTYFPSSPYLLHKQEIEKWIEENVLLFYVFRIPQIIGSTNQNQLLGFLNSRVSNNIKFNLFNIERNLIDFNFLYKVVNFILRNRIFKNQQMNISYPENISVVKLVSILEMIHKKEAIFKIKNIQGSLIIDSKKLNELYETLGLIHNDYYVDKIKFYYE